MVDTHKTINMNKELVKAFVQECIDVQDWETKYKTNHIEMDNYFKYSGKIENEKNIYDFTCNSESFVIDTDDKVVRFYLKNGDISLVDIGKQFGCSSGSVKNKLDKYFKDKTKKRNGN